MTTFVQCTCDIKFSYTHSDLSLLILFNLRGWKLCSVSFKSHQVLYNLGKTKHCTMIFLKVLNFLSLIDRVPFKVSVRDNSFIIEESIKLITQVLLKKMQTIYWFLNTEEKNNIPITYKSHKFVITSLYSGRRCKKYCGLISHCH